MALLLFGGEVLTPTQTLSDGAVLVEGSHIARVGSYAELQSDAEISERIDVGGRTIVPGFIDLQLNGANGRMLTSEPTAETVRAMAAILPRFGCTAVLPTTITSPVDQLVSASRAVASATATPADGARVLGLHLEGPFINVERSGAHHKAFIRLPTVDVLHQLWESGGKSIRMLTLAPDCDGAIEVIDEARRLGMTVAIGHTNAGPDQINQATDHGATVVTHLFNAMAQLVSRAPGTVGGALSNDELYVSVIADGVHVHPVSLGVAARAKGAEKVILITDGMPPLGTSASHFLLDGQQVEVRDGACYRPDGVLAGSVLTMDLAVRNMHHRVGVSLIDAVSMASLNPARAIGVADRKGSLAPGKDADLVVLDHDLNVWLTMVEGRVRYSASSDVYE